MRAANLCACRVYGVGANIGGVNLRIGAAFFFFFNTKQGQNVNYNEVFRVLLEEQEKHPEAPEVEGKEYTPWVYDFRAGHWGCGWVEYIIVRKEAPDALLTLAGEIFCALSNYPVFCDYKYSEAQHEAIYEYWENICGSQEQIEYLIKSGMSEAEAARLIDLDETPDMPDSVYDELHQSEMFY